jgi:hypothetical protein
MTKSDALSIWKWLATDLVVVCTLAYFGGKLCLV